MSEPEPEVVAVPKSNRRLPLDTRMIDLARRYYAAAVDASVNGGAIRVQVEGYRDQIALREAVRRLGRLDDRKAHTHTSGRQITIWVDSENAR